MVSTLTKGQINTFFISASCCWGQYGYNLSQWCLNGDPIAKQNKIPFMLCWKYQNMIEGYDPANPLNCITPDQAYDVIQRIAKILGICTDLNQLVETN